MLNTLIWLFSITIIALNILQLIHKVNEKRSLDKKLIVDCRLVDVELNMIMIWIVIWLINLRMNYH